MFDSVICKINKDAKIVNPGDIIINSGIVSHDKSAIKCGKYGKSIYKIDFGQDNYIGNDL